jgi:hypothetical protein
MSNTRLSVLAVGLAAAVVSACGSAKGGAARTAASSTGPAVSVPASTKTPVVSTAGAPLPHARWIAKGDAICERALAKVSTLTSRNAAQFIRALPQAAIYYSAEAESLGKLAPPRPRMHDWERIVRDLHLIGEYASAAGRDQRAPMTVMHDVLSKTSPLQADMIATARRDGFKWCSRAV